MNPTIVSFAEAAHQFCDYIEAAHTLDVDERLLIGASLLASVYACALRLPDHAPQHEDEPLTSPDEVKAWRGFGELTLYWQVPDPYDWGAPLNQSLSEDLLAVRWDVKRGLLAYERGLVEQAVREWRNSFPRWGSNAVGALRALHRAIQLAKKG
jgi:hypothetical protein